jgi:hypothetical protein
MRRIMQPRRLHGQRVAKTDPPMPIRMPSTLEACSNQHMSEPAANFTPDFKTRCTKAA